MHSPEKSTTTVLFYTPAISQNISHFSQLVWLLSMTKNDPEELILKVTGWVHIGTATYHKEVQ